MSKQFRHFQCMVLDSDSFKIHTKKMIDEKKIQYVRQISIDQKIFYIYTGSTMRTLQNIESFFENDCVESTVPLTNALFKKRAKILYHYGNQPKLFKNKNKKTDDKTLSKSNLIERARQFGLKHARENNIDFLNDFINHKQRECLKQIKKPVDLEEYSQIIDIRLNVKIVFNKTEVPETKSLKKFIDNAVVFLFDNFFNNVRLLHGKYEQFVGGRWIHCDNGMKSVAEGYLDKIYRSRLSTDHEKCINYVIDNENIKTDVIEHIVKILKGMFSFR
jgi:hypothetical protein